MNSTAPGDSLQLGRQITSIQTLEKKTKGLKRDLDSADHFQHEDKESFPLTMTVD